MANPELNSGFDTNNTNTTTIPAGKILDGYANGAILPSNEVNELFKQLFEAANKAKVDGAWDWEAGLTYRKGALVWYNDTLWKSIAAGNIGNVPVTGAFWKQPGIEDAVSLTGNQTIDGIKTFNTSPVVPTPTTGTQVANKDYVDINTKTDKATPVDADELMLSDSISSFSLKKLTFANLKATLLIYFDTLYSRTSTIFGIGQTWQDVTSSRSFGVTYTNNTGKPIQLGVYVRNSGTAGGFGLFATIDGTVHEQAPSQTIGPQNMRSYLNVTVPHGSTYELTIVNGMVPTWNELR